MTPLTSASAAEELTGEREKSDLQKSLPDHKRSDPRVELYSVKLLKLTEPSQALILRGNMQSLSGLPG